MATSISLSNLTAVIESFQNDIQDCDNKFVQIEESFVALKDSCQRQKYEMDNILNGIHHDLLSNLKGLEQCDIGESLDTEKCSEKLDEFSNVLESYKRTFSKTRDETENLKEVFLKDYDDYQNSKETVWLDSTVRIPEKTSPHILNSRQTSYPFIVMVMKTGAKHHCFGCKQMIPLQGLYLSHIEEYPVGSKSYIPHCYHICLSCLTERGFERNYLNKTEVISNEVLNKELINELGEIGFTIKKNQFTNSITAITTSDNESTQSMDSDFPDDKSDISNVATGIDSLNIKSQSFTYHRKPPTQKKIITCKGCQSYIDSDSYLVYGNSQISPVFHIRRSCIQAGGVAKADMSRTRCYVYKLLQSHSELKELISCGFYFNKIIGVRPPNPIAKKPSANFSSQMKSNAPSRPKNMNFLFNQESFVCQKLLHGEKCRGCEISVKKEDLCLRHKEQVPRENIAFAPFVSQFYHTVRQCLLTRGFTMKYLNAAKCKAILSGDDNLARVTDILVKCGFHNENIVYSTNNPQEEVMGFGVTPPPQKSDKEYKLFIDHCVNSSTHCEGCGFILMPGNPCFIYALQPLQDSAAKLFHIRPSCLKSHFTNEEIMGTTCVRNNKVDVSPNDIIRCGLVKIIVGSQYVPPNLRTRNKGRNAATPAPTSTNTKPAAAAAVTRRGRGNAAKRPLSSFTVDIVIDSEHVCCTCKRDLLLDRYFLRIDNRDLYQSMVHLDADCVDKLGLSREELANCALSCSVFVSADWMAKLHECGFRNFTENPI